MINPENDAQITPPTESAPASTSNSKIRPANTAVPNTAKRTFDGTKLVIIGLVILVAAAMGVFFLAQNLRSGTTKAPSSAPASFSAPASAPLRAPHA